MVDRANDAWAELRTCLEVQSHERCEEVRTYPTPIARCDEQLTKAIDDREAAMRQLRIANELDAVRPTIPRREWLVRLRRFADDIKITDSETVMAASHRLVAALER